jgi:hypothetical protein
LGLDRLREIQTAVFNLKTAEGRTREEQREVLRGTAATARGPETQRQGDSAITAKTDQGFKNAQMNRAPIQQGPAVPYSRAELYTIARSQSFESRDKWRQLLRQYGADAINKVLGS